MSDSEDSVQENSEELSENEANVEEEEVQDDDNGLEAPEDDEDSDVTWQDLVRIENSRFFSPRGFDVFRFLAAFSHRRV